MGGRETRHLLKAFIILFSPPPFLMSQPCVGAGGWGTHGEDSRKGRLATGADRDSASHESLQPLPTAFPDTVEKWQLHAPPFAFYMLPLLRSPFFACCSLTFTSALNTQCNPILLGLQGSMEELMPGSVPVPQLGKVPMVSTASPRGGVRPVSSTALGLHVNLSSYGF